MQATDKPAFAALLLKTWKFYGKAPDREDIADWFALLEGHALEAIARAFQHHLTDPKAGSYLPKPADVVRHLPAATLDDGHPGPDEAWGMLIRLIRDERETGVLTEAMRAGWECCGPILDLGDEVGARRCFLDVYTRQVAEARNRGFKARWTVTLGTDIKLREQRLQEALQARRIDFEQARSLLPGPSPLSLDQVAGLLEGPEAPKADVQTAGRLRALAEMLRGISAAAEQERAEEREVARLKEAEQKARIRELLDDGQDAAFG